MRLSVQAYDGPVAKRAIVNSPNLNFFSHANASLFMFLAKAETILAILTSCQCSNPLSKTYVAFSLFNALLTYCV